MIFRKLNLAIPKYLLLIAFLGMSVVNLAQNQSGKTYSILFIGNSLTYSNNLPKIVEKKAKEKGFEIKTKLIAHANYAIIDHWKEGEIQRQIESKKYDFVIVQQGPSSQNYGKELLIEYGQKLNDLCKKNGSRLCFFMVWPSLNLYHTFDGVIESYSKAASITQSILCPVGKAWKDYFDKTKNFDLYGTDGFHPSLKGSQKAAEVIVASLFLKN